MRRHNKNRGSESLFTIRVLKLRAFLVTCLLMICFVTVTPASGDEPPPSNDAPGLSFHYHRSPADEPALIRTFRGPVDPVSDVIYIYATVHMGPANPIKYVDGVPQWRPKGTGVAAEKLNDAAAGEDGEPDGFELQQRKPLPDRQPQFLQTVAVGTRSGGEFTPVVRFGLGNDRQHEGLASVCAWVSDGKVDYFAPVLRPNTPYDFKLRVDLKQRRVSAWVSGRGDEAWFLLTEDARCTV